MRKHKSNNSHQQQRRTTVNVKAMADTLGVTPIKLRKWLRRQYGRREIGKWPWLFTEKRAEQIIAAYREDRR